MSSPRPSVLRTFELLSPTVAVLTAHSPQGCHCPSIGPSAHGPASCRKGAGWPLQFGPQRTSESLSSRTQYLRNQGT